MQSEYCIQSELELLGWWDTRWWSKFSGGTPRTSELALAPDVIADGYPPSQISYLLESCVAGARPLDLQGLEFHFPIPGNACAGLAINFRMQVRNPFSRRVRPPCAGVPLSHRRHGLAFELQSRLAFTQPDDGPDVSECPMQLTDLPLWLPSKVALFVLSTCRGLVWRTGWAWPGLFLSPSHRKGP